MPISPHPPVRSVCSLRVLLRVCLGTMMAVSGLVPVASALDPRTPPSGYLIKGWQTESGLPSNKVRALRQTRDGYLWLATQQGLARFDGVRFVLFNSSTHPILRTGYYYQLLEESDGTLWAAGTSGLYRYRAGEFTRFTAEDGLPTTNARSLSLRRDGSIAVGTGSGTALLRHGRIEAQPPGWNGTSGNIRSYAERADGTEYFAGERGLWRVAGGEATRISQTPDFPGTTYACFLETPDGKFWIGSSSGLHCLHPDGRLETFNARHGLTNLRVQCITQDRDGNTWIGTTAGLFRLRDGKIEEAAYPDSFGSGTVVDIVEDREGALWVATFTGLFRLTNPVFRGIGMADGLAHLAAYAVLESQDHTWWIGTWGGGIYRYDGQRATRIRAPRGMNLDQVAAFHEEPDGTLWIGGYTGLYRYANGAFTDMNLSATDAAIREAYAANPAIPMSGMLHTRIRTIAGNRDGGILVGTNGGLYAVKDGVFRVLINEGGLTSRTFRSIVHARDRSIWTTTIAQVIRWKDGERTIYTAADGLDAESPLSLFEDSQGTIWLTTDGGGLNRFAGGRWTSYKAADGLAEDFVSSIAEDDLGHLWLSSSRGVMRIALSEFAEFDAGRIEQLRLQLFTKSDGMPVTEMTNQGTPNAMKTRDGRLVFTTDFGVTFVDPRSVRSQEAPPLVHIEEISVGSRKLPLDGPREIPPAHAGVQVRYTAISLSAPEKISFKVKLSPLETEWRDAGNDRQVRYPRLPHGSYQLNVIASNNDGAWNQRGAVLDFVVLPFWYQTVWFRTALALFAVLASVGGYRWRMRVLHRRARALEEQNVELERRISERTAELAKSYDALRSSEYFYHSLVESLPQIIVRKDAEGRFTYANSGYSELLERPLDEIVGKTDADLYPPAVAAKFRADDLHLMETHEVMEYENVVEKAGRKRYLHMKKVPMFDTDGKAIGVLVLFWDMSVFRETEEKLKQAQKELVEISRLAGIAEMATGVLHNIGNVLNSVNTSASLASERIRSLKIPGVGKVAQMLTEQQGRLAEFFANDPRGAQLPAYLALLTQNLSGDRETALRELRTLESHIEHIKQIVVAQQSHARVADTVETVPAIELLEYALRVAEAALSRHGVTVSREFIATPLVKVQRQKALQILVNLLRNAEESLRAHTVAQKNLSLGIRMTAEGMVQLRVSDNGVGIAPENLTRIFAFGFTTKKDGHGFGLHSSALAAREMGGVLTVQSDGSGLGATFVLELPAASPDPETPAPASTSLEPAGANAT